METLDSNLLSKSAAKPNLKRAKLAIWSFYGQMTLAAIMIAFLLITIIYLNQVHPDYFGYETTPYLSLTVGLGFVTVGYAIAYVFTVITFCMWFGRAYKNLHRLGYEP